MYTLGSLITSLCVWTVYMKFNNFPVSKSIQDNFFTTFLPQPMKVALLTCLILLLAIGVVLFIQRGVFKGFSLLLTYIMQHDFKDGRSWGKSFEILAETLRLAEGGHYIFGSYIPTSKPDFWRFMFLTSIILVIIVAASIYYHLFLGLLLCKLNMDVQQIIKETEENVIFVLFPTFLGILPSPYFFCMVFFLVIFLLNFFSIVVKVIVLERSLTRFYNFDQYSKYVRFTLCFAAVGMALSNDMEIVAAPFADIQDLFSFALILFVGLQMVVVIVYGLQNFFDDAEFMMTVKLKIIIKVLCIFTPFLCMYTLVRNMERVSFKNFFIFKVSFLVVLATPIVIGFLVQVFRFAKKKNIIGILRPTPNYGPPAMQDKILRHLYNRRLMVRYKRHEEICYHDCLINSIAIKTAIEVELEQIRNFITEMKIESENRTWQEKVIEQFQRQEKYLVRALHKYKNVTE